MDNLKIPKMDEMNFKNMLKYMFMLVGTETFLLTLDLTQNITEEEGRKHGGYRISVDLEVKMCCNVWVNPCLEG